MAQRYAFIGPVLFTVAVLAGCSSEGTSGSASGSASVAASGSAAASGTALKVGDEAPALTFELQDGKKVELKSLKGKDVLVYFYPKDDTPGCTVEAQGINDAWADFQQAGIEVFGVSTQDAASHVAFIDKYALKFPLVVDTNGAVTKAFGVPMRSGMSMRQSFLIGKDGKIRAMWPDVDPAEHAQSVLAAAKS